MTKILGTITDEDGQADGEGEDSGDKRAKMEAMVKEELSNWGDEKENSRPSTGDSD